jgi:hypothetical protein
MNFYEFSKTQQNPNTIEDLVFKQVPGKVLLITHIPSVSRKDLGKK